MKNREISSFRLRFLPQALCLSLIVGFFPPVPDFVQEASAAPKTQRTLRRLKKDVRQLKRQVSKSLSTPKGIVIQRKSSLLTTVDSTTSAIPFDTTIPQNTEGKEFTSLSFTPLHADSTLVISVELSGVGANGRSNLTAALFVDSESDAIAAGTAETNNDTFIDTSSVGIHFVHEVLAGSTAARTYKVRFGGQGIGGRTYVNRTADSNPIVGGIINSGIIITEIRN